LGRLAGDLVPGEPCDEVAAQLEVGVAGVVAPARDRVVVEAGAVDLDDEPLLGPEEVDGVGAEMSVDPRFGQSADESEEAPFEL
jgi:hypothetical protein